MRKFLIGGESMKISDIDNLISEISKRISDDLKCAQIEDVAEMTRALAELLSARAGLN